METRCIALKQYEQTLIEQAIEQGIEQGAFEMALRVKKRYGIDVALLVCDFSREELESEKLNSKQKFKEIFE